MKKIKFITVGDSKLTLEKAFEEFILFCKQNNYREDTIKHYKSGYKQIEKFLPSNTPVKQITINTYNDFLLYINNLDISQQTILSYAKDFKRIVNYFISKDYTRKFMIKLPRVDNKAIECYSDEEIKIMLKRPKNPTFTSYRDWVICNFILSTGIHLSSLTNIKIKDLDINDCVVNIMHTKNRKPLLIPLNSNIVKILKEYLKQRQSNNKEDYLFCNVYNKQLTRLAVGQTLRKYNKDRKIETTGIHRLRHTFAKKWILGGNSVVTLQKILGHSSLEMTQKYINVLITDLDKEVNRYNILQEFSTSYIKMNIQKGKWGAEYESKY